jgi:hypothetical protein
MDFDQVLYHFSLSRVNPDHVDGDRSGFYPKFLATTKQRGDLRCVNDVLARQARDIWTSPADVLPLDRGCSLAFSGHCPGYQFTGCAAAQHKNVNLSGSLMALISFRSSTTWDKKLFAAINPGDRDAEVWRFCRELAKG